MSEESVGIRELKAKLSSYMAKVKAGTTLVVTERGVPVGRITPIMSRSTRERLEELRRAGFLEWNGQRLSPHEPVATVKGDRTVAELLVEDRE